MFICAARGEGGRRPVSEKICPSVFRAFEKDRGPSLKNTLRSRFAPYHVAGERLLSLVDRFFLLSADGCDRDRRRPAAVRGFGRASFGRARVSDDRRCRGDDRGELSQRRSGDRREQGHADHGRCGVGGGGGRSDHRDLRRGRCLAERAVSAGDGCERRRRRHPRSDFAHSLAVAAGDRRSGDHQVGERRFAGDAVGVHFRHRAGARADRLCVPRSASAVGGAAGGRRRGAAGRARAGDAGALRSGQAARLRSDRGGCGTGGAAGERGAAGRALRDRHARGVCPVRGGVEHARGAGDAAGEDRCRRRHGAAARGGIDHARGRERADRRAHRRADRLAGRRDRASGCRQRGAGRRGARADPAVSAQCAAGGAGALRLRSVAVCA